MKNRLLNILNDLFFVVFFLLFFLAIKPALIYHYQQLGFSTAKTFFSDFASYPGGIVEYISLFLFQFYAKSFFGALVCTLIMYAILKISGELLSDGKYSFNVLLRFFPVVMLGILYTDYSLHPVFPLMVLMLFSFFYLFKFLTDKNLPIASQLILNFLLLTISYYVIGEFIFIILCISAIIYSIFSKKKGSYIIIGLIIVLFALLPYLAQSIFFINSKDAYFKLVPYFIKYKPGFFLYGVIFSLPFIILVQKLISIFSYQKKDENDTFILSKKFQFIQVAGMILLLIFGMVIHVDRIQRLKLEVNYLAYQQKWDELLKLVEKNPSDERLVQFQTSRALYHTGVLMDKLFYYSQIWGVDGLILTRYFDDEILLPSTELLFDLSYINEATHYGNEAISQNEYSPILIEQLIMTNIVDNKYMAAKLYINELKKMLFHKKKAEKYEQYVNGGSFPEIDNIVEIKRKLMPVNDFKVNRMLPSDDLLNLLEDKPQNKMAYEYLMAYFLLNNDVNSFFKYYSLGRIYKYEKIPRIFQEALILFAYQLKQQGKSTGSLKFEKEISSQFNEYVSILNKNGGNKESAKPQLKKKFGNTYWFYVNFNSPITNNKKIITE